MTPKQEMFVREYLVDLNATQAAVRAGYSAETAYSQGQRLLKNVEIADAVQAAMDSRSEKTEISAEYVLTGIQEVAERCLQRAPVMVGRGEDREQLIDDEGRHVWQFDAAGANRSFELLGKHLKLFADRLDINVTDDAAALLAAARQAVR